MTVEDYLDRIKDKIGIARATTDDDNHSNTILIGDLYDALKEVILDGKLHVRDKWLRIVADQYKYPLPANMLAPRSLHFLYSNEYKPIEYQPLEEFLDAFRDNISSAYPNRFTVEPGTSNVIHATGTVTTANASSPPVLIDSTASFGITLTANPIFPGDVVWNTTDNSYGYVDYIAIQTADKVIDGATATDGSATTLIDAGQDFSSVTAGMIISVIETGVGESWGVITDVDDSNDTLTVERIYGDHTTFNGMTYDVGPGNEIHLTASGLVVDAEEGLVGGAENDFDVGDSYQIESQFDTLDTLLLAPVPSTSDDVGARSLLLYYHQAPVQPTELYHPVPMNDAFAPAIIAKMIEYAGQRDTDVAEYYGRLARNGQFLPYPMELERCKSRRRIVDYSGTGPIIRKGRPRKRVYDTVTIERS